jgi:hypothetical protein
MKKFFKNLFTLAAVAGVAYVGYKGYQRITNATRLSKTLPDYLEDLLDERPKVNVNIGLMSISIAVGLSADCYESLNFDLDEQIISYVTDYYPALGKLKINVTKYIQSSGFDFDFDEEDLLDD